MSTLQQDKQRISYKTCKLFVKLRGKQTRYDIEVPKDKLEPILKNIYTSKINGSTFTLAIPEGSQIRLVTINLNELKELIEVKELNNHIPITGVHAEVWRLFKTKRPSNPLAAEQLHAIRDRKLKKAYKVTYRGISDKKPEGTIRSTTWRLETPASYTGAVLKDYFNRKAKEIKYNKQHPNKLDDKVIRRIQRTLTTANNTVLAINNTAYYTTDNDWDKLITGLSYFPDNDVIQLSIEPIETGWTQGSQLNLQHKVSFKTSYGNYSIIIDLLSDKVAELHEELKWNEPCTYILDKSAEYLKRLLQSNFLFTTRKDVTELVAKELGITLPDDHDSNDFDFIEQFESIEDQKVREVIALLSSRSEEIQEQYKIDNADKYAQLNQLQYHTLG